MRQRIALAALTMTLLVTEAPAAPVPAKPDAAAQAKIRKLQIERRDVLKEALRARQHEYEAGRGTQETVLKAAKLLSQAELDMATTVEQQIAAHAAFVKLATHMEELSKLKYEAGQVKAVEYFEARAARMEAEIGWLKAGGKEKTEK